MKRTILIGLCAGLILIPGASFANQESQNLQTYHSTSQDEIDSRLMKKVTLEEADINLVDLMKKLTEQTGVVFKVDSKPEAWSVRERVVHIYVKEITLQEIQNGLKKLLMYSWMRTGSPDAWEYTIYQSDADRVREKRLLTEKQQQDQQQRMEQISQMGARFQQASQVTPEQAQQLKESDPWAYLFATWQPARNMGNLISHLPQGALEQATMGNGYSLPYQEMSPRMQRLTKNMLNSVEQLSQQMDPNHKPQTINDESLKNFKLAIDPPRNTDDPFRSSIMAEVNMTGFGHFPLMDMNSDFGKAMGTALIGMSEGKSQDELRQTMRQQMSQVMVKQYLAQTPQIFSEEKPPKDPMLLQEIELKSNLQKETLADLLKKGAAETKFSMICDVYPTEQSRMAAAFNLNLDAGKKPMYQVFNQIGRIQGKTWFREGSLICWQNPEWVVTRTWEIPQDWINYFKGRVTKDNQLELDDLIRMAAFTKDQLTHRMTREKELQMAANWVADRRNALSLCGSLKESQKIRARSERGLAASSLTRTQWNLAQIAMTDESTNKEPQNTLAGSVLFYHPEADPVTLVIQCPNGNNPSFILSMPKQTQPEGGPRPRP